ncbi:hypothetical protein MNBD_ALPHA12-1399 [hydrothermal vent metagenome]|uniref:Uncharacterized protein n=1 Tax=hydrothermal vent metagenome TaxID=652676 RepID=A0A3B0TPB5_9ZZZZ
MLSGTLKSSIFAIIASAVIYSPAALAENDNSKMDKRVQNIFNAAQKYNCESLSPDSFLKPGSPEIYNFTFNYGTEDFPPRPFRLYVFDCTRGAYNFGSVFYGVNDYDEIKQLQFAVPDFDVIYKSKELEADVKDITINGFYAYDILIGPEFNPETKTLTSFSKWRGMADASSSGTWVFKEGNFVLKSYDVDATYDEKMNPVRIYGEGKAPEWD